MLPDRNLRLMRPILCILGLLATSTLLALPEDSKQQYEIYAPKADADADKSWTVLTGTQENPARIKQGTMLITAPEIRYLDDHNQIQTIIATGNPARFQQQPKTDQELVKASGKQLKFDNNTRNLTIDTNAELNQGGKLTQANHIDYNADTGRVGGEQFRAIFPPNKAKP